MEVIRKRKPIKKFFTGGIPVSSYKRFLSAALTLPEKLVVWSKI